MTTHSAVSSRRVAAGIAAVLSGLFYLLAVVLLLVLCLAAAAPFVGVPGGGNGEVGIPVSFTVDDTHPVTSPTLGIDNARIRAVNGTLSFPPRAGRSLIALWLFLAGAIAIVLWVTAELRAVLRTVRDGQPFAPANANRVRRIAWIVIFTEPVRAFIVYSSHAFAMRNFSSPGLHFNARVDFNPGVILCGLIILVLAEIFRAGTQLDEEQSLTI